MRRRDFIAGIAGSGAAWQSSAQAQPSAMPVIGYLGAGSPLAGTQMLLALRRNISEAGYVEGRNVVFDPRWAEGQYNRLPEIAAEFVRRQVAVIIATGGTAPALAAKAATVTIPIVFSVTDDPVALGLVASLALPGGNATGVSFLLAALGRNNWGCCVNWSLPQPALDYWSIPTTRHLQPR
jgi:putative tryptophan/tyrosine transport system substrate-binding protein